MVSIENDLNALALLASGQETYLPLVAEYAREVAGHQPKGHISWGYAYATLFLAEYTIARPNMTRRSWRGCGVWRATSPVDRAV